MYFHHGCGAEMCGSYIAVSICLQQFVSFFVSGHTLARVASSSYTLAAHELFFEKEFVTPVLYCDRLALHASSAWLQCSRYTFYRRTCDHISPRLPQLSDAVSIARAPWLNRSLA